jgi:hypothetical protein
MAWTVVIKPSGAVPDTVTDIYNVTWSIVPTWSELEIPDSSDGDIVAVLGSVLTSFIGTVVDPVDPVVTVNLGVAIENLNATTDVPVNYIICDRTGYRIAVNEPFRMEWDGLMVRKRSLDQRHPQDHLFSKPELQKGSPAGEGEDTFLDSEVQAEDL